MGTDLILLDVPYDTFTDRIAIPAINTKTVTLYRVYGGKAGYNGGFWTFEKPTDRLAVKDDLALNGSWGNSREFYDVAEVPADELEMWIGEAAPQTTASGSELSGGGSQVYIKGGMPEKYIKEKNIEVGFHSNYSEFEKNAAALEEENQEIESVEVTEEIEIEETIEEDEGIDW